MTTPRIEIAAALGGGDRRGRDAAAPRECCGLIEGVARGRWLCRVRRCIPRAICAADADRFEIDPRDHIAAVNKARARQRRSHHRLLSFPSRRARPEPSARDLAGAGEEDFLWLIAAGESLAAFVYLRGRVCRR